MELEKKAEQDNEKKEISTIKEIKEEDNILISYIKENPDCPLDEVITDYDLLSQLNLHNKVLCQFLGQHISAIINYLISDINEITSYRDANKYPFYACEILCTKDEYLSNSFLESSTNYIQELISCLNRKNVKDGTIPGYIHKIIDTYSTDLRMVVKIEDQIENIFQNLFEFIEYDSYANILESLLAYGLSLKREKFLKILSKLLEIFFEGKELNESKLENICFLIVKLTRYSISNFEISLNEIINKNYIKMIIDKNKEEKRDNKIYIKFFSNLLFYILLEIDLEKQKSNIKNKDNNKDENNKEADKSNENKTENYYYNVIDKYPNLFLTSIYDFGCLDILLNNQKPRVDETDKNSAKADEAINDGKRKCFTDLISLVNKNIIDILLNLVSSKEENFLALDLINLQLYISNDINDNEIEKIMTNQDLNQYYINLLNIIVNNPLFSLFHNKVLELFIQVFKPDCKLIVSLKNELIKFFSNYFSEESHKCLLINENIIINRLDTNVTLINILKIFDEDKDINANLHDKIFTKYLNNINKGLLENERDNTEEYAKKNEDEDIMPGHKVDLHDTEGYIFSSKKVIEKSMKITKKLIELDEL